MFLKLAKELSEIKLASKDVDVEWFSKIASNKYINDGRPLNETIAKIAEDNGLNDEFVKRICETSNHQVSSHLFNTSQDKNFEFELADWEKILPEQQYKFAEENPYSKSPSFYKEAIVGPITDLMTLGIPSMVRYHTNKGKGEQAFNEGKKLENDSGGRFNAAKVLLIPGQLGASLGYDRGHAEGYLNKNPDLVDKDPILDPYFENHTSDSIKNQYMENRRYYQPERKNHILNKITSRGSWAEDNHEEDDDERREHKYDRAYSKYAELSSIQLKTDPYESVMDLQESLLRAQEDIETKYEANEREQKLAYRKLYNEFKDEVKEASYFKVAQALVPFVKQETLEELTYDLIEDNVVSEDDLFKVEKLAGSVDESAIIIKIANYYDSLKDDYSQLSAARKELSEQVERVSDFLRNK